MNDLTFTKPPEHKRPVSNNIMLPQEAFRKNNVMVKASNKHLLKQNWAIGGNMRVRHANTVLANTEDMFKLDDQFLQSRHTDHNWGTL